MSTAPQAALASTMLVRMPAGSDGARWLGLGAVILAHLVALYFLLRDVPAREVSRAVTPLVVHLVTPVKVEIPPPPPRPPPPPPRAQPKPRLEPIKAPEAPPRVDTPPAPALMELVPPPPVAPAPSTQPGAAPTAAPPVPSPTSTPPPIAPPSFNAAYLRNEPPRYPNASRRTGEQGRVLLRVYVSTSGTPEKVELHTSSGFERLDQAALETVRAWKFVPAHQAGTPIAAWVLVPIAFTLAR